jgi:hypothetical protein
MAVGDNWFRYEDVAYAQGVDEYGDIIPGEPTIRVLLRKCKVLRETPKGVWVEKYAGDEVFIRNSATKKYAYSTIEEAKKGFIARKNAQLRILRAGVVRASKALKAIQDMENKATEYANLFELSTPKETVQ